MVGEPADIEVSELEFPDSTLPKLAGHKISPLEVLDVLTNAPDFFHNLPGRSGTYVMLGPNRQGRFRYVVLIETEIPGTWRVITGYPYATRRALRYYRRQR